MTRSTALKALSALLLLAAPARADFTVDVGRGPITIHTPAGHDALSATPLVLLLHGYTATGAQTEAYANFLGVLDTYGFLYAYPDGLKDVLGYQYWNATDACCDLFNTGVDDSGYLRALIDAVKAQVAVDERRVFVVGHSNGGFMAYRMACDHADAVAAAVSLAGATWANPNDCGPSGPVQTLQIHGTSDDTIDYNGGNLLGVPYPGAVQTAETWATYDGCALVPDNTAPNIDLDAGLPGDETQVTKYETGCVDGGSSELWTIVGGEHVPVIVPEFAQIVIEWLYAHPRPGIDVERYCDPAVANSTGLPAVIDAQGSDAVVHDDLTLLASSMPANQFGYFLASQTQGFVANPGGSDGNLCLGGNIARFAKQVQNSGMGGEFSVAVDLANVPTNPPQGVMTGETWSFQAWFRDGMSSNFTDGIGILFR